jgi:hypothetical protein
MNELELAEFVDEVAENWRQDGEGKSLTLCTNVVTRREAELASQELLRRGLPISVWAVRLANDGVVVL